MQLDPRQREAVEYGDGPLLIVAGPGSGKTRVLVHRVAHMIATRNIPAGKILLTTFTKKAAEEMRERLRGLIGNAADDLWLGTVHSRCLEVLRKGGPQKVGLPVNFTVCGDDVSRKMVEQITKGVAAEVVAREQNVRLDDVQAIDVTDAMNRHGLDAMHGRISFAKEWNLKPADMARHSWKRWAQEVYFRYNTELRKNGLADFGDLQMLTVEMLSKDPQVLKWIQDRFSYVLVDEYQDTNAIQAELFRLICHEHRNLTVVGDADQSIYAFRGATPTFMLDFAKEWYGAKRIDLDCNYRSTGSIVDVSRAVIVNNAGRFDMEPRTDNPPGAAPVMVRVMDQESEADWLAKQVRLLHDRYGVPFSEMAVLYRTHRQSRLPERAFRLLKLPFEILGGMPFFERREVKDLLAWLALLINPQDRESFRRAMFAPPRGVGDITLKRVFDQADTMSPRNLIELARSGMMPGMMPKQRKALRVFGETAAEFLNAMQSEDLLVRIAEETGYRKFLNTQEDGVARLENVDELCALYSEFDPPAGMEQERPKAFLDWAATELQRTEAREQERGKSVMMMTMHAAKGTEFNTVFVIGCMDGVIPSFRADDDDQVEEERRLFYVAMTRAKERLYMLAPSLRLTATGERLPTTPSPFLFEAEEGGAKWAR